METFIVLFVIGLGIYLNWPEKKPPPKDPWEELGKAIGNAVKSVGSSNGGGGGGGGKKQSSSPLSVVLTVALIVALLGYLGGLDRFMQQLYRYSPNGRGFPQSDRGKVLAAALMQPQPQAPSLEQWEVVANRATLYLGPGAAYATLTTLAGGTLVAVEPDPLLIAVGSEWQSVQLPNRQVGFVRRRDVQRIG